MRTLIRRTAVLAGAGALILGLGIGIATAQPQRSPGSSSGSPRSSVQGFTNKLVRKLSANYQVAKGYPKLYTIADCRYTFAVLRNCLGNNPAAPYILPVVPTWPNEFSDPALKNMIGPTRKGTSATYRLDPREAIVVLGTMPPPGRYMGIQSYVATRTGTFDTSSPAYQALKGTVFFAKLPGDPSRVESFSSIGNSINNVNIQRRSGASFGTRRYFIITPDKVMNQVVRRALGQLGVSSADIFTEPVSYAGMRLGLARSADDFITVMRYALPSNPKAGDKWRKMLPLSVVLVRERPTSTRKPQPFPISRYDTRSATPEAPYKGDLTNLIGAVCKRWGSRSCQPTPMPDVQAPPVNLIGSSCRPIGMNCLGDTQDTSYNFSGELPLDQGQIYAVVGTLGTETGNATYVSLGINDASKLLGVGSVDDTTLKGTASSYAPTVSNTGKFFVYYLTRNCAGLQSLTGGNCRSITDAMVPPGVNTRLTMRDYIRPGTARGPNSTQLLNPVVIPLARPNK